MKFSIKDFSSKCDQIRRLSYRNQSIDLQNKSMDWFLYDNLRIWSHLQVKSLMENFIFWAVIPFPCFATLRQREIVK